LGKIVTLRQVLNTQHKNLGAEAACFYLQNTLIYLFIVKGNLVMKTISRFQSQVPDTGRRHTHIIPRSVIQRFAGWLREPKLSLNSSSHCIVAICVN
jgi:hypothetical protein